MTDKYIHPQAYLAIGNAEFNRAYRLLESIETIKFEIIHGDLSVFSPEIQGALRKQMETTVAILEGSYTKKMDEAIAYWKSYRNLTKKEKE